MQTARSHSDTEITAPSRRGDGEVLFDRYRLVRKLGEGGMGVVWLAHDERLGRPVAIKRIASQADAAVDKRAGREATAAARLAHPAIVALYEATRDGDDWVLVCELVRGPTLQTQLREGALSDRGVAQIGIALCDALGHAHGRGVVHRDIKPANVICPDADQPGAPPAKLTDFGVASLADDDGLTMTGDVIGTLAYMAPEQARGRTAGPPADVYALGVVLYEAFAGINPRRGSNAAHTARLVDDAIAPLHRVRRDLPRAMTDVIDATLAHDPRARPRPAALRAALRAAKTQLDDAPGVVAGPGWEPVTDVLRAGGRAARDLTQVAVLGRPHDEVVPDVAGVRRPRPAVSLGGSGRGRLGAGLLAGGGLAGAMSVSPVVDPSLIAGLAGAAAVVVAVLPRLGWLAAACLAVVMVATADPGAAVLMALALGPIPLLLFAHGSLWSVGLMAVPVGMLGVAPAFVGVAALGSSLLRRAALGAIGAWMLLLAAAPLGTALLGGPGGAWSGSLDDAFDVVSTLAANGSLAYVALWAGAAPLLGSVVRGRYAVVDIAAATGWAAGVISATNLIAEASVLPTPPGLVLGTILAAVVVVLARALGAGQGVR